MKQILCSIFILLLFYSSKTKAVNALHTPLVINYTRSEYKAMSQNWAITFDEKGRVYFGNSGGILEYDGKSWKLHEHKSKSAIRALYYDSNSKRLYSGCFEDFGFWKRDVYGNLNYTSLADRLKEYTFSEERIWSIVPYQDEILFQSFSALFSYNKKTDEVKHVKTDGDIMFLNLVGNDVYTQSMGKGIAKYEKGSLKTVNKSLFAQNATIRFFIPHKNGIIVGDGKTGLYILKDHKLSYWNCEANQYLSSKDVNSAIQIDSATYAIGTLKAGLFIMDTDGNVLHHFDRQTKLNNNTVLGMGMDYEGSLWLGMDNGISYVNLHPSIEYKIDLNNVPSAIYSVIKHKGFIYIGTNNGVFFSKFEHPLSELNFEDLKPLPDISGHIWKLDLLNDELLCGNNDGIYQMINGKAILLSKSGGGTDFISIQHQLSNWLIESTYYKIRVHKRENNQWVFSHFVDGFHGSCRFVEMDHVGYLWLSHEIKGLTRLKLSDDLKTVISTKEFGIESGLPTDYGLNVFKVNNRVVITTGEKIYTFDYLNEKIVPYNKLNSALGRFKKAVRIISTDDLHFWVITDHEAAYIENKADSIRIKRILTLNEPYSFPDKYQNISISENNSVLCLENGIAIIPNRSIEQTPHLPIFISEVMNQKPGIKESKKRLPLKPENPIVLKNKNNTLQFCLTAINYDPNNINYQYRIKNLNTEWVDSQSENIHTINNIPDGEYVYQARVVYPNGQTSNLIEYPFKILPKWYASKAGIIIIALIILGTITFLILFNQKIIRMHTSEIEQKHQDKHKQDQLTIEQLQNDVLKKELENLQGKLTISANALVEKDKSIKTIKAELHNVYKKLEGRLPQRDFNKIIRVIDSQITQKRDMLDFEQHFAASQSGFYDKLKQEYPSLSPSDLRLCSLLKMNMNSKEISVILAITVRSVEVSRYRLRKKMNLNPDDNLSDTIMRI